MRFTVVLSVALSLWAAEPAHAQEQAAPDARTAQLREMMAGARFQEAIGEARAVLALTHARSRSARRTGRHPLSRALTPPSLRRGSTKRARAVGESISVLS